MYFLKNPHIQIPTNDKGVHLTHMLRGAFQEALCMGRKARPPLGHMTTASTTRPRDAPSEPFIRGVNCCTWTTSTARRGLISHLGEWCQECWQQTLTDCVQCDKSWGELHTHGAMENVGLLVHLLASTTPASNSWSHVCQNKEQCRCL